MIPIVMVLRPEARNADGVDRVQRIAVELGLIPTASGTVSISLRISEQKFQALFGKVPRPIPARPPGTADAGAPAGWEEMDLPVPENLATWVESMGVMPPAIRLKRRE